MRGTAAKALLEEFFAQGVPYYTQVSFEDEAARVGELVRALGARMDVVRTATADEVVVELTAAHGKYAALLASTQRAEHVRLRRGQVP